MSYTVLHVFFYVLQYEVWKYFAAPEIVYKPVACVHNSIQPYQPAYSHLWSSVVSTYLIILDIPIVFLE